MSTRHAANAVGASPYLSDGGGSEQGCAPAGHSLIVIYHNIIILKLTAALFSKRLIYRRATTNRVYGSVSTRVVSLLLEYSKLYISGYLFRFLLSSPDIFGFREAANRHFCCSLSLANRHRSTYHTVNFTLLLFHRPSVLFAFFRLPPYKYPTGICLCACSKLFVLLPTFLQH